MPELTLIVDRIDHYEGTSFWEIRGHQPGSVQLEKVTTNSAWKAALCERAKATQQPIRVGWRDTARYGRDVVTLALTTLGKGQPAI